MFLANLTLGGKKNLKSAGGKGDTWFNQSDGALHMEKKFGKTEDEKGLQNLAQRTDCIPKQYLAGTVGLTCSV